MQLRATQTRCELGLECKRLEIIYAQFLLNKDDLILKETVRESIAKLLKLHHLLKSQITHSYITSLFLGIKYGLVVYGVTAAFLFMVSSVFLITATVFPPALLMAFIVSGVVFILIVTAHALRTHYLHVQSQKNKSNESDNLVKMQKQLDSSEVVEEDTLPSVELLRHDLKKVAKPEASPKFTFQEWLEILRCFFSGLSKGNNFATFVGTPLQDVDSHGHDHNAPSIMLMLQIVSTALFSIVLALRALARGFGKDKSDKPKVTQISGESSEPSTEKSPEPQSQMASAFYDNFLRFFPPKPSSPVPNKITENTTPDLALGHCTF